MAIYRKTVGAIATATAQRPAWPVEVTPADLATGQHSRLRSHAYGTRWHDSSLDQRELDLISKIHSIYLSFGPDKPY
jgi:hypothetical protein